MVPPRSRSPVIMHQTVRSSAKLKCRSQGEEVLTAALPAAAQACRALLVAPGKPSSLKQRGRRLQASHYARGGRGRLGRPPQPGCCAERGAHAGGWLDAAGGWTGRLIPPLATPFLQPRRRRRRRVVAGHFA